MTPESVAQHVLSFWPTLKEEGIALANRIVFVLVLCLSLQSRPWAEEPPYGVYQPSTFTPDQTPVLINWNSEEGKKRLARCGQAEDFYQLAHFFQPQINPLYCGIASSVIVLNAMRIPDGEAPSQEELEIKRPLAWGGSRSPYPSYSQITFLNEKTDQVKAKAMIRMENLTPENTQNPSAFDPGLTLAQLKGVLEMYQAKVELHHADLEPEKGIEEFRQDIIKAMKDSDSFVILNFKGNTLGAITGGHISPAAAYDQTSDSILVLDVAGHKNPWYWVPLGQMYQAMHTKDGSKHRGWLTVRDGLDGEGRK